MLLVFLHYRLGGNQLLLLLAEDSLFTIIYTKKRMIFSLSFLFMGGNSSYSVLCDSRELELICRFIDIAMRLLAYKYLKQRV